MDTNLSYSLAASIAKKKKKNKLEPLGRSIISSFASPGSVRTPDISQQGSFKDRYRWALK